MDTIAHNNGRYILATTALEDAPERAEDLSTGGPETNAQKFLKGV